MTSWSIICCHVFSRALKLFNDLRWEKALNYEVISDYLIILYSLKNQT